MDLLLSDAGPYFQFMYLIRVVGRTGYGRQGDLLVGLSLTELPPSSVPQETPI